MTADFALLLLAGILSACGVYLLLERAIIKILLGIMILSNGINLLVLAAGGPPGNPPIRGRGWDAHSADSDPLAQAMILTAIVITAGVGAFILALAYRSYQFTTVDEVADDAEDAKIARRSPTDAWSAPDRDRSDDHVTGAPTEAGDQVDYDDEELEDGIPEPGGDDPAPTVTDGESTTPADADAATTPGPAGDAGDAGEAGRAGETGRAKPFRPTLDDTPHDPKEDA